MTSEIGVTFVWNEARPDNREFRQNSCMLVPLTEKNNAVKVWVGVPFDAKHIHNYTAIATAQLDANATVPDLILTAKGMRVALDKLGEYFPYDTVTPDDFKQENPDAEDWDDTSTEPTPVAGIDWSDNSEAASNPAQDEKWDEADNDVKELWNESEEKWDE